MLLPLIMAAGSIQLEFCLMLQNDTEMRDIFSSSLQRYEGGWGAGGRRGVEVKDK